jgi:hypothetical protein
MPYLWRASSVCTPICPINITNGPFVWLIPSIYSISNMSHKHHKWSFCLINSVHIQYIQNVHLLGPHLFASPMAFLSCWILIGTETHGCTCQSRAFQAAHWVTCLVVIQAMEELEHFHLPGMVYRSLLKHEVMEADKRHGNGPQDLVMVSLCIQIAIVQLFSLSVVYACSYHNPTMTHCSQCWHQHRLPTWPSCCTYQIKLFVSVDLTVICLLTRPLPTVQFKKS